MIDLDKILEEAKICKNHEKCEGCPLAREDDECGAGDGVPCIAADDGTMNTLLAVRDHMQDMENQLAEGLEREKRMMEKLREVEKERTALQIKLADLESATMPAKSFADDDDEYDHADDMPCCDVVDRQDDILLALLRRVQSPDTTCSYQETAGDSYRSWSLMIHGPETLE